MKRQKPGNRKSSGRAGGGADRSPARVSGSKKQAMSVRPVESRLLTIRTAPDDAVAARAVTLAVTDAGPPVEAALIERMFEPFYTTKADGLGMGLSISKSIVDAHGGRIWPAANPLGGLTMYVRLPTTGDSSS